MSAHPSMWPAYRIPDSPELAALDGLAHVLRIALSVTRAMNPSQATPRSDVAFVRPSPDDACALPCLRA